ncbi:MAG: hydrolase [Patescibacteria group bacterium]
MANQKIKSTGCCEPFNPKPWQDKEISWKEKLFVKDHVTSFLHTPLNFGQKVIERS